MDVIRNPARMSHLVSRVHTQRKRIGLVPTWGGLHEGHLSMIRTIQGLVDVVVVSIIPPSPQSGTDLLLRAHPSTLTQDVELLVPTNIDYVFAPKRQDVISPTPVTEVVVHGLKDRLFGGLRTRFYTDATTELVILLNITRPDVVSMSQKDPQLLMIARHIAADLHFACQIMITPTVREPDGTAASWWLPRLSPEQRQAASLIYKGLEKAQVLFGAGERQAHELVEAIREVYASEVLLKTDYIGIVDPVTLEPIINIDERPALAAVAVTIGDAHLIDNLIINE